MRVDRDQLDAEIERYRRERPIHCAAAVSGILERGLSNALAHSCVAYRSTVGRDIAAWWTLDVLRENVADRMNAFTEADVDRLADALETEERKVERQLAEIDLRRQRRRRA
jgi:hypothetical protein